MTSADRFVDAITVSFAVAVFLKRHARAVVEDDISGVMVLVKSFCFVTGGEAACQIKICGTLIRTHLETIAVTVRRYLFFAQKSVFVGNTVFEDDGDIVSLSAVALVEGIPAVIGVQPGATSVEVIACANRKFRRKTIGIALSFVTVQVTVAVDNPIVRGQILHLQTRISVFVEVALFNEIVMSLIVGIALT